MMKNFIFLLIFILPLISNAQQDKIGSKAPDFRLKNVDGNYISLSDFSKEKGIILIFTCNHCPYAKAYESRIIDLDKKYKSKGYPVVAINPNDPEIVPEDSYESMKIRANEKGFSFPYLFDEDQTVFPKYGANKTPHVYVLQKQGNDFIIRYVGTIDNNYEDKSKVTEKYVASAINELMNGRKPDPETTKAIGCSIKYKKDE